MKRLKILIATGNQGKLNEFLSEFGDLGMFKFVSLVDLGLTSEICEPHDELWQNAYHKAKFYAERSRLPTIAEDSGFFVDYLKGVPGAKAKRFGRDTTERINKILKALKHVPPKNRGAYFVTTACFYHPASGQANFFTGKVAGRVNDNVGKAGFSGMDYDAIFYFPPLKKLFSELTILEKNQVSHRGQIINQLKYFLVRNLSVKQIVVATALIVRDRKLLLTKRRDHRPEFNNRWEFPGGVVDDGETATDTAIREVKEETGLNVQIIAPIPKIYSKLETKYSYQVFLINYLCRASSGPVVLADHEIGESGWFTLSEAAKLNFLPLNNQILQENSKLLKKYVRN